MPATKVVIFDLGGVIVKINFLTENPAFLARCSVSTESARSFSDGEVWHAYEKGRISTDRFVELAVSALGYRGVKEEFRHDFCEMLEAKLDSEVFSILCSLKQAYGREVELWMLSNINELHYNYLRAKWPGIFSNFFEAFLSFEIGERKPCEAIFKKVLAKGRAHPKQCLFFDDLEENVLGARKAGMEARRFTGVDGLRGDLAAAGFVV